MMEMKALFSDLERCLDVKYYLLEQYLLSIWTQEKDGMKGGGGGAGIVGAKREANLHSRLKLRKRNKLIKTSQFSVRDTLLTP